MCALSILHLSNSVTLCQTVFLVQGVKIEKYVFSVPQPHVPLQIHGQYQREEIYLRATHPFHLQVWLARGLPVVGSIYFVITYLWTKRCLRRERWLGKEARIVPFSSDTTIQIKNLNRTYCFFHNSHILARWSFTRNSWKLPHHFQGHQRLECLQEFLLISRSLLSEFPLLISDYPQNIVFRWINLKNPVSTWSLPSNSTQTHTSTHTQNHDWTIHPQI